MTDPDSPAATPDDAPIDAEFEEAPPPAPRTRRRMPGWLPLAVIAVVAVVLIVVTGPWAMRWLEEPPAPAAPRDVAAAPQADEPTPQDAAPAPSAALDAAQAEIGALRAELEQLRAEAARPAPAAPESEPEPASEPAPQAGPVPAPADPAAIAPAVPDAALAARVAALELSAPNILRNEDRLDRIEDRLAQISDAIGQLPDRREYAALGERVEAMEMRAARSPAEAAYRFAALREAATRGAPFEAERSALARLRPQDPDLAAMADSAAAGVPTVEELRLSFPAAEIRSAAAFVEEDTGRFAWLRNWFSGLVRVRRADGVGANPDERAAAAADAALAEGDLIGAIDAVRDLNGPAADAASYWLGRAEARARLDARIEALQDTLASEAGQ